MANATFPIRPERNPSIYAYSDSKYPGWLKIGYTTVDVRKRVSQQYPINRPEEHPYTIVFEEPAIRNDGSTFMDYDVHHHLKTVQGISRYKDSEWFKCEVKQVRSAWLAIKEGKEFETTRDLNFPLRPEQELAIQKTIQYYTEYKLENPDKTPKFLWNAKMRFGKTFTAYQLAQRMKFTRVLVLTFKPAVQSAWKDDLLRHVDFAGWQFISRTDLTYEEADKDKPLVCFGSFQDYLGKNELGGIKPKNAWVHTIEWDLVILDEYHYGAWRETAQDLFASESKGEEKYAIGEGVDYFDEELLPIKTHYYLYLSGTPFRALTNGEFIEEQIYNWTYSDEQKAKEEWNGADNPYAALPKMVLMTYQLPEEIRKIALQGEFNEFDLNVFFSTEGEEDTARFIYEDEVQKWLDLIRGEYLPSTIDNLKLGSQKPPLPYADVRFLNILTHTIWFLPSVSSCYAMRNLLKQRHNRFYHDYTINVAAGTKAGIGVKALSPVRKSMENPLETKTITLTCGKLTTGITIKPWTGIFMLRNLSSPETYFQAAFRVQSPWVIYNPDGMFPNKQEILKQECYVFDFAPERALRQIADYSCRLNIDESNPEKKVAEFIHFLPIYAYDGSPMKEIDAGGVLDLAMSGTTATLLARRWESALLVNVDNTTLERLLHNEAALAALMSIEGFRSLNTDIETIINKSESLKKAKQEANNMEKSEKTKKELTEEEREIKNLRKQIQEKLIKFATRIPVFMYLTDYRELALRDVISQIEPDLFKKVTGLTIPDFELLVSLDLFNSALMNDAVYKFKRYEDTSLSYSGIIRHRYEEKIGLYDTVISKDDASQMR